MPEPKTADRIVLGNVVTLDKRSSRAEALAIADGRVLTTGTRDDVMLTRTRATKVDDYTGATIIPGFNDAHAHLATVGLKTLRPTLAGARSISDVLERIRRLASTTPKGEWIVTMPVGEPPYYFDAPSELAEGRMPDRRELDSAAPDHPVYLSSPGGYWGQTPCHSSLNSLGLKLNGIDRNTKPASPSIEIVRDAGGEPTGVIIERSFASIVEQDVLRAVPRFDRDDRLEALRRAIRLGHEKGTTSVYEGHGCAPEIVAAFRYLHESGELTMRSGLVLGATWVTAEEAERTMRDWLAFARGKGLGDPMLKISGVFLPCFGEPHLNAIVARDVSDLGWGDYIRFVNTSGDFERQARLAAKYDLRVHTVISNRLDEILPILERLAKDFPLGRRRWVLEHISQSSAAGLQKIRALGVGVTLIPAIYLWKGAQVFDRLSGEELDFLSPARQLLGLGVPVSAGTDAVPNDPLHSMWAMVTRRARSGRVMGGKAALTNEEALRLVTVNGAWLTFEEHEKGPLIPGYFADLAVLAKDPLAAAGDAILDNECIGTMVGGRWVHGPHADNQGES
jgi:predicted amidohydrolase YtcJ